MNEITGERMAGFFMYKCGVHRSLISPFGLTAKGSHRDVRRLLLGGLYERV